MAKPKKHNDDQSMMFVGDNLAGSKTAGIRPSKPLRLLGDYRLVTTPGDLTDVEDAIDSTHGTDAMVSFDTEFSGAGADVNVHRPELCFVGLSIAIDHTAWYVPLAHRYWDIPQLNPDVVRQSLNGRLNASKLATHNGKCDTIVLRRAGYDLMPIFFDTYTASHTLQWKIEGEQAQRWASRTGKPADDYFYLKGLKAQAENELGVVDTIDYAEVIARSGQTKNASNFALVGPEDSTAYVGQDADLTLRLANRWRPLIDGSFMEPIYRRITMPLLSVLAKMEQRGIYIDLDHYRDLVERYTAEISDVDAQLRELLGRNTKWKTDYDLRYLFHTRWKFPIKERTRTGEPAVGKSAIAEHVTYVKETWKPFDGAGIASKADMLHVIKLIQTRAKTSKLLSTYDLRQHTVSTLTVNRFKLGIVHTQYNESGTATNRLASSSPNSQNMPAKGEGGKDIRNGIIAHAKDGHRWHMMVADLSQIEPRCTAFFIALLGDHSFLQSYKDNKDIYKTIASAALAILYEAVGTPQRSGGKVFVLAATYGSSAAGLAGNDAISALGLDLNGTQNAIDLLFEKIPGLRRYHWNAIAWGLLRGYTESLWGFARPAHDLRHDRRDIRSATVRALMNHVIQSFAAQVLGAALVWLDRILTKYRLEEVIHLILQIHDEIDSRVRDDYMHVAYAAMNRCMRHVTDIGAPMKIDVEVGACDEQGSRWGELIPYDNVVLGPQHPDSDTLIAAINTEQSPFADMPLAQMTQPFDLTAVADDDLPIYLWHAANLSIVLDDPRLPVCTTDHPKGYIVDVRSYDRIDKRSGENRTTYRAVMVGRGANVPLISFSTPLIDGYAHVQGVYQEASGTYKASFRVDAVLPLDPHRGLRDALRTGTPIVVNGYHIDCAGLRTAIDLTQA